MNRNNYQLGSTPVLNEKAEDLMNTICFLSNERVYFNSFPNFSTIEYTDIDENELLQAIEDLEDIYREAVNISKYGYLHHRAHPYYLEYHRFEDEWDIHPNDTEYGTDQNFSAPICSGKTALSALKNAWKMWSIPPVLILNSEYYIPGVSIGDVIE